MKNLAQWVPSPICFHRKSALLYFSLKGRESQSSHYYRILKIDSPESGNKASSSRVAMCDDDPSNDFLRSRMCPFASWFLKKNIDYITYVYNNDNYYALLIFSILTRGFTNEEIEGTSHSNSHELH